MDGVVMKIILKNVIVRVHLEARKNICQVAFYLTMSEASKILQKPLHQEKAQLVSAAG
jgi:hypothetical protein